MQIQVGDKVTRMLAGTIPSELTVTEVTDDLITCGGWTFDPKTGAEIDDELGWGPLPKRTGSFLKEIVDGNARRAKVPGNPNEGKAGPRGSNSGGDEVPGNMP